MIGNPRVGHRIRTARNLAGLSKSQLADALQVDGHVVDDIEHGRIPLSDITVRQIAETTKQPEDYFTSALSFPYPWGVGMPHYILLLNFAEIVHRTFGTHPILVGSALCSRTPRDIDVRLILDPDVYERRAGPASLGSGEKTPRAYLNLAFSALGEKMTGLPIDFQIQHPSVVHLYDGEDFLPLG